MLNDQINTRIRFNSYAFALTNCILGCALGFFYGHVTFETIITAISISITGVSVLALCNYSIDYSRAYKLHLKDKKNGIISPIMVGDLPVTQLRKRMAIITLIATVFGAIAIYIALGSNIQVLSWFIFLCVMCVLATLFYNVSALYLYRGLGAIAIFLLFGMASVVCAQFLIVAASHSTIDIYPDTILLAFSSGAASLMILYGRSIRMMVNDTPNVIRKSFVLSFGYKITSIYLLALLLANIFFSVLACVSSHRPIEALLLLIGFIPMSYQVYTIIRHMKMSVILKQSFNNLMSYCCINNLVWVIILTVDYWLYN